MCSTLSTHRVVASHARRESYVLAAYGVETQKVHAVVVVDVGSAIAIAVSWVNGCMWRIVTGGVHMIMLAYMRTLLVTLGAAISTMSGAVDFTLEDSR